MPESHLTSDQLVAIRDGELRDWASLRHFQSCPECQARLRDARTLRVLLTRPESTPSSHPDPEDLAAYAEDPLLGGDIRSLEAHVAGCPQCFADLQAIREQLQPEPAQEEGLPEWVVAKAVRDFRRPEARLKLGTLLVQWFSKIGPWIQLIPPPEPRQVSEMRLLDAFESRPRLSDMIMRRQAEPLYEMASIEVPASEPQKEAEEPPEGEPVDIPIGYLNARVTPRGQSPGEVTLIVVVTRTSDSAPEAGAQLSLKGDEGTLSTATTDKNGVAEFPLPRGRATLIFQSPVLAELQISF